jgi:hypothetical protein
MGMKGQIYGVPMLRPTDDEDKDSSVNGLSPMVKTFFVPVSKGKK